MGQYPISIFLMVQRRTPAHRRFQPTPAGAGKKNKVKTNARSHFHLSRTMSLEVPHSGSRKTALENIDSGVFKTSHPPEQAPRAVGCCREDGERTTHGHGRGAIARE
jgi:hypothetical protein